jgi:hypothetical protein
MALISEEEHRPIVQPEGRVRKWHRLCIEHSCRFKTNESPTHPQMRDPRPAIREVGQNVLSPSPDTTNLGPLQPGRKLTSRKIRRQPRPQQSSLLDPPPRQQLVQMTNYHLYFRQLRHLFCLSCSDQEWNLSRYPNPLPGQIIFK